MINCELVLENNLHFKNMPKYSSTSLYNYDELIKILISVTKCHTL